MAASFTIAGRNNGFGKADTKAATLGSVTAYREAMAGFAQMGTMEVWYAHLAEDDLLQRLRDAAAAANKQAKKEAKQAEKTLRKGAAKARTRDSCRPCPGSASWSTAATGSSASPHRGPDA
jgi:hypothetical protein